MPQNKNLTQICLSEGGFGKTNGVIYAVDTLWCQSPVTRCLALNIWL